MSGVAVCYGAGASDGIDRMITTLCHGNEEAHQVNLADGVIVGIGRHPIMGGRMPVRVDDRFVVTFDGEIFEQDVTSAARTISYAVISGDTDALKALNGTFAAIVADETERRLYLLADRTGSRPLFFWQNGTQLFAATRLKALLTHPKFPRKLSWRGVAQYLAHQRTFANQLLFSGINILCSGQMVMFDSGRAVWSQPLRLAYTPQDMPYAEYREALTNSFRNAVARRSMDKAKIALLLSGGLDSRIVLGALSANGVPALCVSVGASLNREIRVARAVAIAADQDFQFLEMQPSDIAAGFDTSVTRLDGLHSVAPSLIPAYPAMAERGINAIMNGHLLDIFFRGTYLPKVKLPIGRNGISIPRLADVQSGASELVSSSHHIRTEWASLDRILTGRLGNAEWRRSAASGVKHAIDLIDISHPADAHHAFVLHSLARHPSHGDFLGALPIMEFRTPALDRDVLDLYLTTTASSRALGTQVRAAAKALYPPIFRLIESNSSAPADWPDMSHVAAQILRALPQKMMPWTKRPPSILTEGSWLNWPEFLRSAGGMLNRVQALATSDALLDSGLFDATGLANVIDAHIHGEHNSTKLLMTLATLDSTLRTFGYDGVEP